MIIEDHNASHSRVEALQVALAEQLRAGGEKLPSADRYADEIAGWEAERSLCHDGVDRWLLTHPGDQPVRGWLLDGGMDGTYRFVAHSMVRTKAGELLDVTLPRCASPRRFIEHPAGVGGFFALLCVNPPNHEVWVNLDGRILDGRAATL